MNRKTPKPTRQQDLPKAWLHSLRQWGWLNDAGANFLAIATFESGYNEPPEWFQSNFKELSACGFSRALQRH